MHKLTLTLSPNSWRVFTLRKQDEKFLAFRRKVLARDNHSCGFCGFQSQHFQEIINIDNDYQHNKLSNMMTACCFCAQCLFLEAVGKDDYGGGSLVYLPEMQQSELNALCHVLFCAMLNANDYREEAQSIYRDLKMRARIVEKKLGDYFSEPATLGRVLLNLDATIRQQAQHKLLAQLRLLPSRSRFKAQISCWAKETPSPLTHE